MRYDSDTPPPALSPTARFLTAHWRIGRAFNEYLSGLLLERYDLAFKDFLVLATIDRGAAYPSDVSKRLKLPKDMTSRTLQTLLTAGFIDRAIDAQDSRRTRLETTKAGRALHQDVQTQLEGLLEPLLAQLTMESEPFLASFDSLSDLLSQNLKQKPRQSTRTLSAETSGEPRV